MHAPRISGEHTGGPAEAKVISENIITATVIEDALAISIVLGQCRTLLHNVPIYNESVC